MKTMRLLVAMLILVVGVAGAGTSVNAAERMGRATPPSTMEKGERVNAKKDGKKPEAKAVKQPVGKATVKPAKKDKDMQRKAATTKKVEVGKKATGRAKTA